MLTVAPHQRPALIPGGSRRHGLFPGVSSPGSALLRQPEACPRAVLQKYDRDGDIMANQSKTPNNGQEPLRAKSPAEQQAELDREMKLQWRAPGLTAVLPR